MIAQPLQKTRAVLEAGISQGLHQGAQIHVMHRGAVAADFALGESRPSIACSPDTINLWLSAGKPVGAVAIMQQVERGRLGLDDSVASHIPEFAANEKHAVTIRHLLTHTCGFRAVIGLQWNDPYEIAVQKICDAPLEPRWIPGQTAGYHPLTSWYIVAELIRRADGRPFEKYVRDEIFLPLGLNDCYVGMPPEIYDDYGEQIGLMYETSCSPPRELPHANTRADAANIRPGANSRGPMRQLARLYQMLLARGELDGVRILNPHSVSEMTKRQRIGLLDLTFKQIIDWGFGLLIQPDPPVRDQIAYGYGPFADRNSFGHSGNQSSCAFCDPSNELIVAWHCNGAPGEMKHGARQRAINAAIYEDLKING